MHRSKEKKMQKSAVFCKLMPKDSVPAMPVTILLGDQSHVACSLTVQADLRQRTYQTRTPDGEDFVERRVGPQILGHGLDSA